MQAPQVVRQVLRELGAALEHDEQVRRAGRVRLDDVRRDLAYDLADQVAPLPATIRRTLYADPEPGTARQLHNQAVDAERDGDLSKALQLAREAYGANPTAASMRYIEQLQDHARRVGYALVDPDTIPSR